MTTAIDAANYLLTLESESAGDLISNLKLQKLLYYAQGIHLAMHDKPLFDEAIQAWQHGPVVASVYHRFKEYGAGAIPAPEGFDVERLPEQAREVLDDVHTVYGQFSAWRLREMTHAEPPWRNTYEEGAANVEIPRRAMKEHFKTVLVSE